jgi:hypothetical protein
MGFINYRKRPITVSCRVNGLGAWASVSFCRFYLAAGKTLSIWAVGPGDDFARANQGIQVTNDTDGTVIYEKYNFIYPEIAGATPLATASYGVAKEIKFWCITGATGGIDFIGAWVTFSVT